MSMRRCAGCFASFVQPRSTIPHDHVTWMALTSFVTANPCSLSIFLVLGPLSNRFDDSPMCAHAAA